jgi:AraC-like DNA-binding protein
VVQPLTDERMLQARSFIDRAFRSSIEVRHMARRAGMSEFQFIRRFHRAFRQTPHRYLRERRIEQAKSLLREGRLSVLEICLEVGFESPSSFSSTFRRATGESPSAYRERHQLTQRRGIPGCFATMYGKPSSDA